MTRYRNQPDTTVHFLAAVFGIAGALLHGVSALLADSQYTFQLVQQAVLYAVIAVYGLTTIRRLRRERRRRLLVQMRAATAQPLVHEGGDADEDG